MKPIDPNNIPDVGKESGYGTWFLLPVDGVGFSMSKDTDDAPSIEQAIDQALDSGRMDVVEQLAKHLERS